MTVLFWGSFLFGAGFLLHLIIWKIRLPKRQTKALLKILFGTLIIGLLILWWIPSITVFNLYAPAVLSDFIQISLFVTSLTLAYMITYSAVEADSPSLVMIINIADAGSKGLGQDDFNRNMTDDVLVKPRVNDLVRDKMIFLDNGKYQLTPKGTLMIRIFIFYRKLMNLGRKGG